MGVLQRRPRLSLMCVCIEIKKLYVLVCKRKMQIADRNAVTVLVVESVETVELVDDVSPKEECYSLCEWGRNCILWAGAVYYCVALTLCWWSH